MTDQDQLDDLIRDLRELQEIADSMSYLVNEQQLQFDSAEEKLIKADDVVEDTNITLIKTKNPKRKKLKVIIVSAGIAAGTLLGSIGWILGPTVGIPTSIGGGALGGTAAGILAAKL